MPQKFHHGDHVKVTDTMPKCMSHFPHGEEAIVEYSYNDVYGNHSGDSTASQPTYSLYIKDRGSVAWYEENLLELISSQQIALIDFWKNNPAIK